jgi:hypothetical protein
LFNTSPMVMAIPQNIKSEVTKTRVTKYLFSVNRAAVVLADGVMVLIYLNSKIKCKVDSIFANVN